MDISGMLIGTFEKTTIPDSAFADLVFTVTAIIVKLFTPLTLHTNYTA